MGAERSPEDADGILHPDWAGIRVHEAAIGDGVSGEVL
jgi:hypothetical protein